MDFKNLEGLTDEQIKRLASFGKNVLEVQGVSNAISFVGELLKTIGSDIDYGGGEKDKGWVLMCMAEYLGILADIEKALGCNNKTLFEYMGVEYEEGVYGREVIKTKE